MSEFAALALPAEPTTVAPDGSDVRVLLGLRSGAMAHFELAAGRTSSAVVHRSVEEIWYVIAGRGQMWRKQGEREEVVALEPGVCLTIPLHTHFQFRASATQGVAAIGVTMPPWPGPDEAVGVTGRWPADLPAAARAGAPSGETRFRPALCADLPRIVGMLADDALGAQREANRDPLPAGYGRAFDAIDSDPNNELVVAEIDAQVVGVLQLTFIPGITYQGGWRALIEGVRVASGHRTGGIGRQLLEWAIERARQRGCGLVQLTSDKSRPDAIRFYQGLGFSASHEGLKLRL
jgi:mannose-6-phosphate isomerase-like protein (cupin superfamily)/GNAT superfamily N-acetyltransferase